VCGHHLDIKKKIDKRKENNGIVTIEDFTGKLIDCVRRCIPKICRSAVRRFDRHDDRKMTVMMIDKSDFMISSDRGRTEKMQKGLS